MATFFPKNINIYVVRLMKSLAFEHFEQIG